MTLRQKRILAILALADLIVVAGLIFSLADSGADVADGADGVPSDIGRIGRLPAPTAPPAWEPPHHCQWQATQRLAQAGLGGTVTLIPNGPLRFEIMYPPDPQEAYIESGLAAQSVWTAFDIATDILTGPLQQEECPAFTRVEVTILVHSTHIHASVRTLDLVALSAGKLSEAEFIERVTYEAMRNP